jgi:hypothetical protein
MSNIIKYIAYNLIPIFLLLSTCVIGAYNIITGPTKCSPGQTLSISIKDNNLTRQCILPPMTKNNKSMPELRCISQGDPHYTAFDGKYTDFYEQGDFLLAKLPDNSIVIHTRQIFMTQWPNRSVNQAVSMLVNGIDVFTYNGSNQEYKLNNKIMDIKDGQTFEFENGGSIKRTNSKKFEIMAPNNIRLTGEYSGNNKNYYVNLLTFTTEERAKNITGHCGMGTNHMRLRVSGLFPDVYNHVIVSTKTNVQKLPTFDLKKAEEFCKQAISDASRKACLADYQTGSETLAKANIGVARQADAKVNQIEQKRQQDIAKGVTNPIIVKPGKKPITKKSVTKKNNGKKLHKKQSVKCKKHIKKHNKLVLQHIVRQNKQIDKIMIMIKHLNKKVMKLVDREEEITINLSIHNEKQDSYVVNNKPTIVKPVTNTPIINSTTRVPTSVKSIKVVTNTTSINSTTNTTSVNSTTNITSVNSTTNTTSVNSTTNTTSVNSTTNTTSVNSTTNTTNVNSTTNTTSVNSTTNTTSVNSTTNTTSVNSTTNTTSVNSTTNTTSVNSTTNKPTISTHVVKPNLVKPAVSASIVKPKPVKSAVITHVIKPTQVKPTTIKPETSVIYVIKPNIETTETKTTPIVVSSELTVPVPTISPITKSTSESIPTMETTAVPSTPTSEGPKPNVGLIVGLSVGGSLLIFGGVCVGVLLISTLAFVLYISLKRRSFYSVYDNILSKKSQLGDNLLIGEVNDDEEEKINFEEKYSDDETDDFFEELNQLEEHDVETQ